MLRTIVPLAFLIGITGCNQNWTSVRVEKRHYMDGYYVHVPWKRKSPLNTFPKPEPFPINHSRIAVVDSAKNTPFASENLSNRPSSQKDAGQQVQTTTNSETGVTSATSENENPVVINSPSQVLQPIPEAPDPALTPRTSPSDTTHSPIAADPILPGTDTSAIADEPPQHDKGFEFPDGTFALTAELGFFNALRSDNIRTKPISFAYGAGLRYSMPIAAHHSAATSIAILGNLFYISPKNSKQYPLFAEQHDKEKITLLKTRFMLSDEFTLVKNENFHVCSFAFGLFGEIHFLSTHTAKDASHKDNNVQHTFYKKKEVGLHSLQRFQFGTTLRISSLHWSVIANYRINKLVQGGPDGGDLPALVIGVEYKLDLKK